MKPQQVSFACGSLKLEGLYYGVESAGPVPAVVVCHPHPLYGGSMRNNVTYALADALVKCGIAALLFNFRGVGRSQGSHGGGIAEQEDVRAALDWLGPGKGVDAGRLGLAGYSFGAGVAYPVGCRDERVKAIALVSPYFESIPGEWRLFVTPEGLTDTLANLGPIPVDDGQTWTVYLTDISDTLAMYGVRDR